MDDAPRLGFCCKWVSPDADAHELRAMNQVSVTVAGLARRERAEAFQRLLAAVGHNLEALARQLRWVAARPPGERLLRIISSLLPAYPTRRHAPFIASRRCASWSRRA